MRLRVANWNVRGLPRPDDQLALLATQDADIVLLQDVGPSAVRAVLDNRHWDSVLDTWSLEPAPSGARRGGCLIATVGAWVLAPSLRAPPLSRRLLAGTAERAGTAVTLLSGYAPTNAGQGRAQRPAFFDALADWLSTAMPPLVLGMDANGPRVDHPDLLRSVWWNPEEEAVLGSGAWTEDALRLWYADRPAEWKRRLRSYPNGPLADSYHRGRKGKYLRCRYDSIRVSPGIRILDVRYLYDDALRAGSDHALVVADLSLP
ncbi:MAG: hypothetical protein ACPL2N_04400 [Candidatus Cryosericum sp.]